MDRQKIFATIDSDLVKWIDNEVENKRFRNRSHAVEFAIAKLKEANSKKV